MNRSVAPPLLAVVFAAALLAGCASTAPTPPAAPSVYDATWAVAPVWPDPDEAEAKHWHQHQVMVEELTATLSAYGQSHVVVGTGKDTVGVAPDSVYGKRPEGKDERPLRYDALQRIQEETGAQYVLLVRAAQWDDSDDWKVRPFFMPRPSGGFSIGIVRTTAEASSAVTGAMLVDARDGASMWRGARGATSDAGDVRATELSMRSLAMELVTGSKLAPYNLDVEASGTLLVFHRGGNGFVAESVRAEGTKLVAEKDDGTTVRLPLHTVTRIKDTDRNKTIFPKKTPDAR